MPSYYDINPRTSANTQDLMPPQMPSMPQMPGMGGMPPMPGAVPQVQYMVSINNQAAGPNGAAHTAVIRMEARYGAMDNGGSGAGTPTPLHVTGTSYRYHVSNDVIYYKLYNV